MVSRRLFAKELGYVLLCWLVVLLKSL